MEEEKQVELFKAGPLHEYRFEILKQLKNLPVKTGDIVFRRDDYRYIGIRFSSLVCSVTRSEYDHASILFVKNDDIFVLSVNDSGTNLLRLIDEIDYSAVRHFSIFRIKNDSDENITKISKEIKVFLDKDPDYDFSYGLNDGKYYCTSAVAQIMKNAGFNLMEPVFLKDIMNPFWYWLVFFPLNWIVLKLTGKGFNTNVGKFFVGNSSVGILASPLIEQVAEVKY